MMKTGMIKLNYFDLLDRNGELKFFLEEKVIMEPVLNANIPEQKERLRRLFRVKATETEMMKQRGYRLDAVTMLKNDQRFNPKYINLSGLSNPKLRLEELLVSSTNWIFPISSRIF